MFGGDGGISARFARRIASASQKSFAFGLDFRGVRYSPGGFSSAPKIKNNPSKRTGLFLWRRWWDSNPRARLRTKRFRVVLVTTTSIHLHVQFNKQGKCIEGVVCAWRSRAFDFGAKAPLRYISILSLPEYHSTILPEGQGFMRKNCPFIY